MRTPFGGGVRRLPWTRWQFSAEPPPCGGSERDRWPGDRAADHRFDPTARIGLGGVLLALAVGAAADDEIFALSRVDLAGRILTTHAADFDGDGSSDLMVVTLEGIPPAETRTIHVYLRSDDGELPTVPNHDLPVPPHSAVYDVADLLPTPGDELVILRPAGISILSVGTAAGGQRYHPVTGPSTVGAGDDERGFAPFSMINREISDEPWILVPQIGRVTALTADGTTKAVLEVGRRANYYVTKPTGLVSVESDIQLFLDVPKLSVGDANGDGLADIVAATRHELRVGPGAARCVPDVEVGPRLRRR